MEKIYKGEIHRLLPIFQAIADGRIIQVSENGNDWIDIDGEEEGLFIDTLIDNPQCYRIKPEPKYRPFSNAEECWQELLKHKPFGWVKDTESNEYLNVYCISNSASSIDLFCRMFKRCIFIDGSPCGVKVEE